MKENMSKIMYYLMHVIVIIFANFKQANDLIVHGLVKLHLFDDTTIVVRSHCLVPQNNNSVLVLRTLKARPTIKPAKHDNCYL